MLNNCIIMGRLTADPELRHTNSGVACCSFTLAVERDGKPNEQTGQRAADFIDCTAWRNTAEFICKWFSKGRVAVAAGRMQTRTWKDRHDQSRKSTELQVESMYFADSRKDAAADVPLADDDLPGAWTELSGSDSYKERTKEDGAENHCAARKNAANTAPQPEGCAGKTEDLRRAGGALFSASAGCRRWYGERNHGARHRNGARDGNRRGWRAAYLGGGRIPVCSKAIDAGTPGGGGEESASCSCW